MDAATILVQGDADGVDAVAVEAAVSVAPGPAAIVEAFNPNTNGATALAKLLFGVENRWGKLPYTIYPASYAKAQDMANFDMSKAPGRTYKYYSGAPLFPFGHGLSLTTFALTVPFV
jgi:beta-glucosidase